MAKPELTPRQQKLTAVRVFLLVGVFFLGHAAYKLYEYSEFEAQPGPIKLMSDLRIYIALYEYGGKWLLVGVLGSVGLVSLVLSGLAWRSLRRDDAAESVTKLDPG